MQFLHVGRGRGRTASSCLQWDYSGASLEAFITESAERIAPDSHVSVPISRYSSGATGLQIGRLSDSGEAHTASWIKFYKGPS